MSEGDRERERESQRNTRHEAVPREEHLTDEDRAMMAALENCLVWRSLKLFNLKQREKLLAAECMTFQEMVEGTSNRSTVGRPQDFVDWGRGWRTHEVDAQVLLMSSSSSASGEENSTMGDDPVASSCPEGSIPMWARPPQRRRSKPITPEEYRKREYTPNKWGRTRLTKNCDVDGRNSSGSIQDQLKGSFTSGLKPRLGAKTTDFW